MAKKRRPRTQRVASNKKTINYKIFIAAGSTLILIGLIWAFIDYPSMEAGDWNVDDYGIMSYPKERGIPVYDSMILNSTQGYTLESINYSSRDTSVKSLLRIPAGTYPVPGVLILPGATVTKEDEQGLAADLADMGYAAMVIDQRNFGGVNFQFDQQLFEEGKEPVEHKMVFDALRAVDVMKQYPQIDPDNIALIGISNGGRFAVIAAAIDPSIKGVIGISTSGYDAESFINNNSGQMTENQIRFMRSIDPDSYLDRLPPRKLVMIHMTNDTIIPMDLARTTYDKADDPKSFYPVDGTGHGYNAGMKSYLENELDMIFR
jgi:dienelactone hydrolase